MYIDPSGHKFTDWDRGNVTNKKDKLKIVQAGGAYNRAKTDKERKAAHDAAEAVRNKYRNKNETGRADGETVNRDTGKKSNRNRRSSGSSSNKSYTKGPEFKNMPDDIFEMLINSVESRMYVDNMKSQLSESETTVEKLGGFDGYNRRSSFDVILHETLSKPGIKTVDNYGGDIDASDRAFAEGIQKAIEDKKDDEKLYKEINETLVNESNTNDIKGDGYRNSDSLLMQAELENEKMGEDYNDKLKHIMTYATPGTIHRINYLLEKITTLKDGEKVWEQGSHIGMWYTREDYELELDQIFRLEENSTYREIEKNSTRIIKAGEGVLQGVGGFTEGAMGYGIILEGWWTGPGAIGAGSYLIADGGSNMYEGINKIRNAFSEDIHADTMNPLRDYGFKKAFGEEVGEELYNKTSIAVGVFAITKGVFDLKSSSGITVINRNKQILRAQKLGIETEKKIVQIGDKIIINTQEVTTKTSTPMVLQRVIIDTNKIGKDMMYIGVDDINTVITINSSEK